MVAPHAGAWIETGESSVLAIFLNVAPHAGAWIETENDSSTTPFTFVAPHAGAWIETKPIGLSLTVSTSRLTQARGLKQYIVNRYFPEIRRASRRRVD